MRQSDAARRLSGGARAAARRRSRFPVLVQPIRTRRLRSPPAAIRRRRVALSRLVPRRGASDRTGRSPSASAFRPATIAFDDAMQGPQTIDLPAVGGDFVIRRRDGLYAYQLAVVVDDAAQRITHVVRGADLLEQHCRGRSSCKRALGLPTPDVRTFAGSHGCAMGSNCPSRRAPQRSIRDRPSRELWRALRFLKQAPPPELRSSGSRRRCGNGRSNTGSVQPLHGLRYARDRSDVTSCRAWGAARGWISMNCA